MGEPLARCSPSFSACLLQGSGKKYAEITRTVPIMAAYGEFASFLGNVLIGFWVQSGYLGEVSVEIEQETRPEGESAPRRIALRSVC